MTASWFARIRRGSNSLRARIVLGVALPVLLALVLLSYVHYWRELRRMEEHAGLMAVQIGDVVLASLHHALLADDRSGVDRILVDVGGNADVRQVLLVNSQGRVVSASRGAYANALVEMVRGGCEGCHQYAPDERPRTMKLRSSPDTLRVSTPVGNDAECRVCHVDEASHLGVLLTDVSVAKGHAQLVRDLRVDLAFSMGFVLLVSVGVFLLIHRMIVHRVERMNASVHVFASGDFSARLPYPASPRDELDALALGVNRMAAELDHRMAEREQQHRLRTEAIVQERERLAHEMHDGLAQVMGYVSAKSSAIRLLLQGGRIDEARCQLRQLADASQEALLEVRMTIFGLRTNGSGEDGLCSLLEQYTQQFGEMTGIQVDLRLPPADQRPCVHSDSELHLLRIVQEALANVHKHARTDRAWVHLVFSDQSLAMSIGDNGDGFDPRQDNDAHRSHFGLSTMRERAEAIGGIMNIHTAPGAGTCVTIRLPLAEA